VEFERSLIHWLLLLLLLLGVLAFAYTVENAIFERVSIKGVICFQNCEGPKSLPSTPFPSSFLLFASLPLPPFPFPLKVAPLIQLGGLGSAVSSHSGVWGAANDFGAF